MRVLYPTCSREELTALLRQRLTSLAAVLPIRRAVLFGSWAAGRATAFSDIDLLLIYSGDPRPDAYKLMHQYIHLRGLESHVYTEREAEQLGPTIGRMTRGGIELFEPGSVVAGRLTPSPA